MARHVRQVTGLKDLCLPAVWHSISWPMGASCARGIFDRIWIQPAAGHAGGALGARCSPGIILGRDRQPTV